MERPPVGGLRGLPGEPSRLAGGPSRLAGGAAPAGGRAQRGGPEAAGGPPGAPPPDSALAAEILARLRDVPDFPTPGILFKDLTPLWRDAGLYRRCVLALAERFRPAGIQVVVGVEARGFVFAAPLALEMGAGFVPARKPGKLPAARLTRGYALEYGQAALELHRDGIAPGERVLVVDDLLATGGTSLAAAGLVEALGGRVVALAFAVELPELRGRDRLAGYEVVSLAAARAARERAGHGGPSSPSGC